MINAITAGNAIAFEENLYEAPAAQPEALPVDTFEMNAPVAAPATLQPDPQEEIDGLISAIETEFPNVEVDPGGSWRTNGPDEWTADELRALQTALRYVRDAVGDQDTFEAMFPTLEFERHDEGPHATGAGVVNPWQSGVVHLSEMSESVDAAGFVSTIIHEMGHVLHFENTGLGDYLSETGSTCGVEVLGTVVPTFLIGGGCAGDYFPGGTTTSYGETAPAEDFADSFNYWVYTTVGQPSDYNYRKTPVDQTRLDYMADVVDDHDGD